ncbi:hypothetical protein PY32053_00764 [Paracoccus yeei]|uniref:Uncharacterized protein n=1 Tax=Paracoccus yeei TaxID=147645 RepID=A0A386UJG0_9RHOB|nr:hypothetical protein [Paracoccus yeei]AYF00439.1 hypothetical protein PY32053_00764 [Paracoccus yeei]AZV00445.1 chaperone protein [Paracoccus phage vB_PyeM_Pyei1]
MKHDLSRQHRNQRERRTPKNAKPAVCAKCNGMGALRGRWPFSKDIPCYWFASGSWTCPACNGTGEITDWQDEQQDEETRDGE